MPNRRIHMIAGSAAGGTTAFFLSGDQDPVHRFFEVLGGVLGGALGGRFPDVVEPAIHAGHRSVAHALVPAGVAGAAGLPRLPAAQQHVRQWADRCRARREAATSVLKRILWWLAEMVCRLVSGALAGAAVGYASHLLLDATTPKGLPLIA